jgi:broad specificity phosphatase PhoE
MLMARLYLVRHGRAVAGFGESHDPGLDEVGRQQANNVAQELAPRGPLPIVSSPLRRTRETAAPLAKRWNVNPAIEAAVAEIPSPTENLQERVVWLREFMAGSWRNATPMLAAWREDAINALLAIREDTVIFSHYIAINVAAGAALGDDRVVLFSPDNCSVSIFENDGGTLRLIEKGREAALTKVN